jgi:hypothetical protein
MNRRSVHRLIMAAFAMVLAAPSTVYARDAGMLEAAIGMSGLAWSASW